MRVGRWRVGRGGDSRELKGGGGGRWRVGGWGERGEVEGGGVEMTELKVEPNLSHDIPGVKKRKQVYQAICVLLYITYMYIHL